MNRYYADMAELADALDLGSSGRPCRFESCYPHPKSLKAYAFGLFSCLEIWEILLKNGKTKDLMRKILGIKDEVYH